MSAEPPPSVKREPLAKSAPSLRTSTKRSISAGSAEPSASNMTTMSPVTRAKPAARALPLPLRDWSTVTMPGRTRRAVAMVPSTEPPSTRITSWTSGSCGSTTARFAASLSAGTTMLTRGDTVLRRGARMNVDTLDETPMASADPPDGWSRPPDGSKRMPGVSNCPVVWIT